LLTFAGVVLPVTAVAFGLSLVLGCWAAYANLPAGCSAIRVVFLNLARGRIRGLVQGRDEQPLVKSV
jgi:hypothetical protein